MGLMEYTRAAMTYVKARYHHGEEGATAVEYGIMVALIAAIIVLVVVAIGTQVEKGFTSVCEGMKSGGIAATKGATACK